MVNMINGSNVIIIELESFYSTLGIPPDETLYSPVTFLSSHNFSDDCWLSSDTNVSNLQGKIAIITELPTWYECASESLGIITGIGRLLQKNGILGVIMVNSEQVFHTS